MIMASTCGQSDKQRVNWNRCVCYKQETEGNLAAFAITSWKTFVEADFVINDDMYNSTSSLMTDQKAVIIELSTSHIPTSYILKESITRTVYKELKHNATMTRKW